MSAALLNQIFAQLKDVSALAQNQSASLRNLQ
jgi:hypothetical protein